MSSLWQYKKEKEFTVHAMPARLLLQMHCQNERRLWPHDIRCWMSSGNCGLYGVYGFADWTRLILFQCKELCCCGKNKSEACQRKVVLPISHILCNMH